MTLAQDLQYKECNPKKAKKMKTILYLVLGIILGIVCINCIISSVTSLLHLAITPCLINALCAFLFGTLAKKCFAKI